jgi:hypothetical protein
MEIAKQTEKLHTQKKYLWARFAFAYRTDVYYYYLPPSHFVYCLFVFALYAVNFTLKGYLLNHDILMKETSGMQHKIFL